MNYLAKLLPLPVALSLVLSPTAVFAATTEEVSAVLFEETTLLLGVDIADEELSESLLVDLEYALEEDVIDSDIAEEIAEAIDSDAEPELGESLEENLGEQEESWLEKSPELLNAFDLVKYEFHQCRIQAVGGASECARGLGFKLQVASVSLALADLETLRASLDGLSGEELGEALALIAEKEQELEPKLARAEAKLARMSGSPEGATELEVAVAEARDAGVSGGQSRSEDSPGNQGNSNPNRGEQGNPNQGNGSSGNGNQGNPNQGNGNQGNPSQGNGNSGNGNQGNPNQGNGNSGNGNQGNSDRGDRGNG